MTPLPRHNTDDSSEDNSDNTEGKDEQEIFSMCYECNEKVPIQMKENGTCHGRCFRCQRRQRHLVCAAVNPDKMIDGVPHSWCEICHQYVTSTTLANRSCHGPCRFCGSRVIHHKCNPAIPQNRQFTTRATQWYPNQPLARRIEEARLGQHLPADDAYQMIRRSNQLANPNMCSIITSASTDRVNEYHGRESESVERRWKDYNVLLIQR